MTAPHTAPTSLLRQAHSLAALLCCALLLTLNACIEDNQYPQPAPASVPDAATYLVLRVTADDFPTTRAGDNPNGGENGDEEADDLEVLHDRDVHNATLFLFNDRFDDAYSNDTPIRYRLYFPTFTVNAAGEYEGRIQMPKTVDLTQSPRTYYAVVVANAGDLTNKISKFGQLRNDTILTEIKKTSSTDITAYDHFVMSSVTVNDAITFKLPNETGAPEPGEPYIVGTIHLQRLAARIDINPNPQSGANCEWKEVSALTEYTGNTKPGYEYTVWKPDAIQQSGYTALNDRFLLTDIYLTDAHSGGTWTVKRTAESLNSETCHYFGTETKNSSNQSTNYVLSYNGTGATWGRQNLQLQNLRDGFNYFIAGYTEENIHSSHITTLHLKGIYKKQKKNGSGNLIDDEYTYEEKEYEYRIRHSDPSGHGLASDPMHFAIVRNNVYRIKIERIVKSDLEHAAVVLYWQDSNGKWQYQDIGISKDIPDDTGDNTVEPNDAPRRR